MPKIKKKTIRRSPIAKKINVKAEVAEFGRNLPPIPGSIARLSCAVYGPLAAANLVRRLSDKKFDAPSVGKDAVLIEGDTGYRVTNPGKSVKRRQGPEEPLVVLEVFKMSA